MKDLSSRLILKNGRIFDSITGKIKENSTIVIEGNKIKWIGEDSSFEKEENDKIIDLSHKTVLPGLIDCHVHLEGTANPQYEREYLRTTDGMVGYIALYNAQKHLSSGFTCIRDCGGDPHWSASLSIALRGLLFGRSRSTNWG